MLLALRRKYLSAYSARTNSPSTARPPSSGSFILGFVPPTRGRIAYLAAAWAARPGTQHFTLVFAHGAVVSSGSVLSSIRGLGWAIRTERPDIRAENPTSWAPHTLTPGSSVHSFGRRSISVAR